VVDGEAGPLTSRRVGVGARQQGEASRRVGVSAARDRPRTPDAGRVTVSLAEARMQRLRTGDSMEEFGDWVEHWIVQGEYISSSSFCGLHPPRAF